MKTIKILVISALLSTSCSTPVINGSLIEKTEDTTSRFGSAVFIENKCLISPTASESVSGIIGGLAESVIDSGFNLFKSILQSAKERKETVTVGIASDEFYQKTANGSILLNNCIQFVEAQFADLDKINPEYDAHWQKDKVKNFGDRNNIVSLPNKYVEMNFKLSEDASAFKLNLGAFHYRKGSSLKKGGSKDIALMLAFQMPNKSGKQDANSAFAIGTLLLTGVKENTFYGPSELKGIETAWLPVRPLSKQEISAIEKVGSGEPHSPYSVFFSMTETEEPSKFIEILAGVLDDNVEPIKTEAKQIIIDLTGLELGSDNSNTSASN